MRPEALAAWARERALPAARAARRRARATILAGWRRARRRPEAVLAAVVVLGVAVMVLHWS